MGSFLTGPGFVLAKKVFLSFLQPVTGFHMTSSTACTHTVWKGWLP